MISGTNLAKDTYAVLLRKLRPKKTLSCLFVALSLTLTSESYGASTRPNILLVVADDMGWADLGSFGSEIRTPNLDALAASGLTMSHFRVAPTCSPTRSMLLTGVDNHLAGLGTMAEKQTPNQLDSVNYGAELHGGVVTVAEALAERGYYTVMAGKWHLAVSEEQYPHNRGFDKSFTLLQGGASHFGDRLPLHKDNGVDYLENGDPVELAADFYSSISYTDKVIQYLDDVDTAQPFFAYVAYTAPHDPLQVPNEWRNRYSGVYDQGPEIVRNERSARQRELGLIPGGAQQWSPPIFPSWLPIGRETWELRTAEERARDIRPMEIYASMVELLDQQIGRILAHLESRGQLENTYVIFMSDNGANASTPLLYPHNTRDWLLNNRDQAVENMGLPGSHTYQGSEWAAASNTPFRLYKAMVAEGGIRVPFIVSGPDVVRGRRSPVAAHAMDVTPTLLELAGIDTHRSRLYKEKLLPQGRSLLKAWRGDEAALGRTLGMELFGNAAVIQDQWKALNIKAPLGSGSWELYDLARDPGETSDLSAQHPDLLQSLLAEYAQYAKHSGVIPPNLPMLPSAEVLYAGPCNWWCQIQFDVLDSLLAFRISMAEDG
ncbi:MAG: arylsulfatase [Halioglobus sp.]